MSRNKRGGNLSLDDLPILRDKTDRLSESLRQRLEAHLQALRPALLPGRIYGQYVGAHGSALGAGEALEHLKAAYQKVSHKPFGLRSELEKDALQSMETRLQLHPWERDKKLESGKTITVTSPLRWLLSFRSDYSLSRMRRVMNGKESRNNESVLQFVLNALVMAALFERFPEVSRLLQDLRWSVDTKSLIPEFDSLPLVCLAAPLRSFLPPDDLLSTAVQLSGGPIFVEFADLESFDPKSDPLSALLNAL